MSLMGWDNVQKGANVGISGYVTWGRGERREEVCWGWRGRRREREGSVVCSCHVVAVVVVVVGGGAG